MPVSAKVADRIAAQMKRYQGVLATIQKKDISEADTVTVIRAPRKIAASPDLCESDA